MRHVMHFSSLPSPLLSPSPPPTPAAAAGTAAATNKMVVSIFMALLLPCAGMSAVFLIYIFLLWYTAGHHRNRNNYGLSAKPVVSKGLSASELEKIPKVTGKELAAIGRATECAVCLEEIESGQPARLVPGCNHGFHLACADTWLAEHPVCPVCRADLEPKLCSAVDDSPC